MCSSSAEGRTGAIFRSGFEAGDGDLFNFQRHDIAAASQVGRGARIVPRAFEARVDDEARGAGGIGIHDVDAIAERARGHGDHAAELPAAENADGRAGKNCAVIPASPGRALLWCGPRARCAGVRADRDRWWRGSPQRAARHWLRRAPDGERAHRHALRHLHDGEQRIDALQHGGGDGHAEHGDQSLRGQHARQVRRAAGSGDDDAQAARFGLRGVLETANPACDARRRRALHTARRTRAGFRPQARGFRSRSSIP